MKTKIAIACQGGGSQAAFTAGALQGLFDGGISDRFEIVALSGTSGGAICAALIWYAIKRGDDPITERLLGFWQDNIVRRLSEQIYNDFAVGSLRMINRGSHPVLRNQSLLARGDVDAAACCAWTAPRIRGLGLLAASLY